MPQFPPLKEQLESWTDAASSIPASFADLAGRTRSRLEQLPRAMVDELRRRVNVLDLATKHDVEAQSKLGRSRVSFVLKEFLEAQRVHDEALVKSLRSELQEELQCFAAAIDDDLFATDAPPKASDRGTPHRPLEDPDEPAAGDEDLDLVDYRGIDSEVDDEIDMPGDGAAVRRAVLDVADD
jgi:hypothetical protein